ncbi:hypothetical protein PUN4_130037 [Paraburkholderia unamae]|nr:hypothetical protein PUN4_130037 [Paraburkholderia unamae]
MRSLRSLWAGLFQSGPGSNDLYDWRSRHALCSEGGQPSLYLALPGVKRFRHPGRCEFAVVAWQGGDSRRKSLSAEGGRELFRLSSSAGVALPDDPLVQPACTRCPATVHGSG